MINDPEILISIIVPVYKIEEEYLHQCLKSLKNQTLQEIEIILINDGSPDNCGVICDEYAEGDNRFKVIHKINQGVSAARNDGIRYASGKWITFVDADDWVELDMCKKIYDKATHLDVDVLFFGGYHNFNNSICIETRPLQMDMDFEENDKEDLQLMVLGRDYKSIVSCKEGNVFCNNSCKLIKTSILKDNNLIFDLNIAYCEDGCFNLYLLEYCNHLSYVNKCFYHYRMRDTSESHRYRPDAMQRLIDFINAVRNYVKIYSKSFRFEQALMYRCYDLIWENLYPCYLHRDSTESIKYKLKSFQQTMSQSPFKEAIKTVQLKNLPSKLRIKTFLLKINAGWLMLFIILFKQNYFNKDRKKYY